VLRWTPTVGFESPATPTAETAFAANPLDLQWQHPSACFAGCRNNLCRELPSAAEATVGACPSGTKKSSRAMTCRRDPSRSPIRCLSALPFSCRNSRLEAPSCVASRQMSDSAVAQCKPADSLPNHASLRQACRPRFVGLAAEPVAHHAGTPKCAFAIRNVVSRDHGRVSDGRRLTSVPTTVPSAPRHIHQCKHRLPRRFAPDSALSRSPGPKPQDRVHTSLRPSVVAQRRWQATFVFATRPDGKDRPMHPRHALTGWTEILPIATYSGERTLRPEPKADFRPLRYGCFGDEKTRKDTGAHLVTEADTSAGAWPRTPAEFPRRDNALAVPVFQRTSLR
jgi:hypothetical protein